MNIYLESRDWDRCRRWGARRGRANRKLGIIDNVDGRQRSLDVDVQGVAAELAFCRMMGVRFDPVAKSHDGQWPIEDAVLNDGRTVDVKSTASRWKGLEVKQSKFDEGKACDVYVLVQIEGLLCKFVGWATRAEVEGSGDTKWQYGKTYRVIDRSGLRSPMTLSGKRHVQPDHPFGAIVSKWAVSR